LRDFCALSLVSSEGDYSALEAEVIGTDSVPASARQNISPPLSVLITVFKVRHGSMNWGVKKAAGYVVERRKRQAPSDHT
jgi:hypothetical protein